MPEPLPTAYLRILITKDGKRVLQQRWVSSTGKKDGSGYRLDVDEWRDVEVVHE